MEAIYIISSVGMILMVPTMVFAVIAIIRGFKRINKCLDRIEERLKEFDRVVIA